MAQVTQQQQSALMLVAADAQRSYITTSRCADCTKGPMQVVDYRLYPSLVYKQQAFLLTTHQSKELSAMTAC